MGDAFTGVNPPVLQRLAGAAVDLARRDPSSDVPALVAAIDPHDVAGTRRAVSELRRRGPEAVAACPALAAWVILRAGKAHPTGSPVGAGDGYAINDALHALRELRAALDIPPAADDGPEPEADPAVRRVASFLDEVFQPSLIEVVTAPMQNWHRGAIAYLRGGHGDRAAVAASVSRFLDAVADQEIPPADRAWFDYARAEGRALIAEFDVRGAETRPPQPAPEEEVEATPPPARVDRRIFYDHLLTAPSAEQRAWGIHEWADHGGPVDELRPLIDDDAPLIREHGGRHFVVEVRALALVALQDRYRLLTRPWPHGSVRVRRAMPVEDAESEAASALAALAMFDASRRSGVEELADRALRERVVPPADEVGPCRAYLVLQVLGRIGYQTQEVDPGSLLTPLQQEINASQMVSARPLPHARFDDSSGRTVGYLYRSGGRWVLDVDESPQGVEIRHRVEAGRPTLAGRHGAENRADDENKADDDDRSLDHLLGMAALIAPHHRVELAGHINRCRVQVIDHRPGPAGAVVGELEFSIAGRRLTAQTRRTDSDAGEAPASGQFVDLNLVLEPRREEVAQTLGRPGPGHNLAPGERLQSLGGARCRLEAPILGLERRGTPGPMVVHVDVGLGAPLRVDSISPHQIEGLRAGDWICVDGILQA